MTFPYAALATSHGSPALFFLIGILIGSLLFYLGFKTYREYRILEDTPIAPIRSIPMGLVHVHGKTTGDDRLTSPLTGVPCYYYRVQVEKYVKRDKNSGWETVRTDMDERSFSLDDGTAKVLVNPHLAEYDVPQTFQAEVGKSSTRSRSIDPTLGVPGPSEKDLQEYFSDNSKARAALASMAGPGASKLAEKAMALGQKLQGMGFSLSSDGVNFSFGSHRYRFTEHCLLAERDCNILGTCAENPSPKDEHDRNLIMRGENEKTFLITTKTEKEIEKSLRRKAFFMVLAGAAILIIVVAIELNSCGML